MYYTIQSNTTIFHLVVQLEYNYMFRPYMWAIFRLWFNLQSSYTRCAGCSFRVLGVGWGDRDLVVSLVGIMTYSYYKRINISCLCTYLMLWICQMRSATCSFTKRHNESKKRALCSPLHNTSNKLPKISTTDINLVNPTGYVMHQQV